MTIEHDAVGDPLTRYASATQTEARPSALADQIMVDKDGPYWDTHHRDHRATVDHVTALLIEARGNEPVIGEDAPDGLDRLIEQSMTAPEGGYDFNINLSDGEEYDDDLMPTLEVGLAILASTNMKHSRWWRIGATLEHSLMTPVTLANPKRGISYATGRGVMTLPKI